MMNKTAQKGVGLVEVLVALLILALGVLGFAALQLRALDAAQEATEQTIAMNTARDLAERMRVNRAALATYKTTINAQTIDVGKLKCTGVTNRSAIPATTKKELPTCNSIAMAEHDASEILQKASDHDQRIVVTGCVGSAMNCIYVAWADTKFPSANISQCIDTVTGAYIANSKCLVMETF
ncbi:MAG: type IV pilus modification protein PilV [Acinetobacter sp.]|jgi:type IV pilus assembly protein PilV